MSSFTPSEKGTTIRVPSTANLMLDSQDRDESRYPDAADFQINKNQSLLNGFFTRIGVTEHVLEWSYPNINADISNNFITVVVGGTDYTAFIPDGFYNVSYALAAVVDALNALPVPGITFSVSPAGTQFYPYARIIGTVAFDIVGEGIAELLFPGELPTGAPSGTPTLAWLVTQPDLRAIRYLDFVSEKATYNQDLKDESTNPTNRNVLARWYMSYDEQNRVDADGYPILMGYEQFVTRRIFNPPKQIRWDNTQPIGQLDFKVFVDPGAAEAYGFPGGLFVKGNSTAFWDWLMTLQVSEV